jgi:hypothetical protein
MDNSRVEDLRSRLRGWTWFLIVGLVVSGATAMPIRAEVEQGVALLGEDMSGGGLVPPFASAWLRTVRHGVFSASDAFPFLFYGTDWLAFGHFMIALAFVGALRDPVRNRWLYQFGMIACALVPVWALVFGAIRGIPLWWRAIDASFGAVGFVPTWLCDRWARALEAAPRGASR